MSKKVIMSIVAIALVVVIGVVVVGCGKGAPKMEFTDSADVINKVVESNSTEFDGITGGYSMLTEADIASAACINTASKVCGSTSP